MAQISSLTQTPPLGWNSFDSYGRMANEKALLENLDVFTQKLYPFGYDVFVLDIGWYALFNIPPGQISPDIKESNDIKIDNYGRCLPAENFFPNGLDKIISKVHAAGCKFGIHMMRGIPRKAVELNLPIKGTEYTARDIVNKNSQCIWCQYNWGVDMSKKGAQSYYDSVIALLAEWGVDFIKYDNIVQYPQEIEAVANAIEKCDREIILSLSLGGKVNLDHLEYYRRANMVRISGDIWDEKKDLDKIFQRWEMFQGTAGPGFWPDMDMIPFGHLKIWSKPGSKIANEAMNGKGVERMCRLNRFQKETFITMRALGASPLFMGGNLPTSDEETFQILTNRDMLNCNQNGIMGNLIYRKEGIDIWKTPMKNNEKKGWLGIFNRNENGKTIQLTKTQLQIEHIIKAKDIWKDAFVTIENHNRFVLPPDGVIFLAY